MVGGPVQGEVLCRIRRPEHLDLLEMQEVVPRQLNANEPRRLIGELNGQRLVVPEAIEQRAVMLIDGAPSVPVVR